MPRAKVPYPAADLEIPRVQRIDCPRMCGWYRDYTVTQEWGQRNVDHPLYGPIPNLELVRLDVRSHECNEYHNSLLRLRRGRSAIRQEERARARS